jgi:hypothetical protein
MGTSGGAKSMEIDDFAYFFIDLAPPLVPMTKEHSDKKYFSKQQKNRR